jgi:hypothetical protein
MSSDAAKHFRIHAVDPPVMVSALALANQSKQSVLQLLR